MESLGLVFLGFSKTAFVLNIFCNVSKIKFSDQSFIDFVLFGGKKIFNWIFCKSIFSTYFVR